MVFSAEIPGTIGKCFSDYPSSLIRTGILWTTFSDRSQADLIEVGQACQMLPRHGAAGYRGSDEKGRPEKGRRWRPKHILVLGQGPLNEHEIAKILLAGLSGLPAYLGYLFLTSQNMKSK
jgi:hypothetical protein